MSRKEKLKQFFVKTFSGRNGVDFLGYVTLFAALILNLLNGFFGTGILSVLSLALYIITIWRMFSKNLVQRQKENARAYTMYTRAKTSLRQAFVRLKNIRKYKYFRCPNCKSYLRLPRGAGSGTVTCSNCKHSFHQKA